MGYETPQKPTTEIILKYYWKNVETKPTGLKAALEKLKTVKTVELPADSKTAIVTYTGKCDKLGALETAAQNAGFEALVLNHAHVVATLKPLKGADPKAAVAEVALTEGVTGTTNGPSGLELHADLEKLTLENLQAAAAKFKCEIIVNQTFEYVKYKVVEGNSYEFQAAADLVKGVMTVRDEGEDVVGMWVNKSMIKAEQLEKIAGFKIERQ
ncbi:MAG TPA: hypothetical protein VFC90_12570 [Planctomycetota bacterium]|nr:hypothetical protein [Planctomycetota bacterium]